MAGLAFNIIAQGIFLIPIIDQLFKRNTAKDTVVAITLGSTGIVGNDGNMGGSTPAVYLYAEDGLEIGSTSTLSSKWKSGTTNFVSVPPNKGMEGKQATYVYVSSGGAVAGKSSGPANDAICISAISVAWPDGSDPKVWLGDIGQNCSSAEGPFWANSVTQTGANPESRSKCIWIDGDASNGITTDAIGLHIIDFGRTNGAVNKNGAPTTNPVADQWNANNDLLCKAPARMRFPTDYTTLNTFPLIYQPPLQYNPDGTDKDENAVQHGTCVARSNGLGPDTNSLGSECTDGSSVVHQRRGLLPSPSKNRRSTRIPSVAKRSTQMTNTIVHSAGQAHSADELCTSPGSISPDFVSYYESKFCDMETRIIWPLCSNIIVTGCFNTDLNKLILDENKLSSRDLDLVTTRRDKEYTQVIHW